MKSKRKIKFKLQYYREIHGDLVPMIRYSVDNE